MDSSQIRCVLEASRTGSFGEAAKNLFMSQSTFSHKIEAFEQEVGFKVFNRSNKGASLTPVGRSFCNDLIQLASSWELALGRARSAVGGQGVLNLSLPLRSCMRRLPDILRAYRDEAPNVQINVNICYDGPTSVNNLLSGACDVVFTFASFVQGNRDVARMHLFDSGFQVIMSKADPLAAKGEICLDDLEGRRCFVSSGPVSEVHNPPEIRLVEEQILSSGLVVPLPAAPYESILPDVASGFAVVIAVDFTDDGSGEFARVPFRTRCVCPCVLATRKDDLRSSTRLFLKTARRFYGRPPAPAR